MVTKVAVTILYARGRTLAESASAGTLPGSLGARRGSGLGVVTPSPRLGETVESRVQVAQGRVEVGRSLIAG